METVMRKVWILGCYSFLIVFLSTLIGGDGHSQNTKGIYKDKSNVIAIIDSIEITLNELENEMQEDKMQEYHTTEEIEKYKRNKLEKLIEKKLYVLGAYEKNLDQDYSIVSKMANLEEKLLLRALFNETIVKQIQTDEQNDTVKQRELVTKFLEDLYEDNNVELQEEGVEILLNRSTSTEEDEEPTQLSDNEMNTTLVTYSTKSWTVGDFETEIKKYSSKLPVFNYEEAVLKQVQRLLQPELLTNKADELKIIESESYKDLYKETLEVEMAALFKRNVIQASIKISDEELYNYYVQHYDEFQERPLVNVREIQVGSLKEADDLLNKIKNGADFGKLAKEHSLRVYTKYKSGELGSFPRTRYPELFDAAQKLKPGEIAGPILMKEKYSIIKLISKKEPILKPFTEVQERIKTTLERIKMEEANENWLRKAKDKYSIKVFY